MKKSKAYQPDLIESLRDSREAEDYLNAALEGEEQSCFCWHYGMGRSPWRGWRSLPTRRSSMREPVQLLSERGNPELRSRDALLHALGFRLAVTSSR